MKQFAENRYFLQPTRSFILFCIISFFPALSLAENESDKRLDVLQKHVKYLSSEQLEGRGSGSAGNLKAAKYIANYFKEHSVQPVNGNYFQEFEVTTEVKMGDGNQLRIDDRSWEAGKDFTPVAFSKDGTISGELAFVGYGITSEKDNFDEYENIDATGKIVIVLRSSPDYGNPHGSLEQFAGLEYKVLNAREHKAAGIIFVSSSEMSDRLLKLSVRLGSNRSDLVSIHAKRAAVQSLLPAGKDLSALEKAIKDERKPQSFVLENTTAEIQTSLIFIKEKTNNVIGLVKGSDPARTDEFIVVGAHYDHLGWGDRGGSLYQGETKEIHHGADDNASGTTAVMEIAASVARNPLPRSVLFMGFSGEEMGLLGSAHYCQNPLIPLEKTVMMLNMDMIGRVKDNQLTVSGTGTSSTWDKLIDSLTTIHNLKPSKSPGGYGPSDYASFYGQNIPVLSLFTGLHDDYHKPSDTWEKVNYEGVQMVIGLAADIVKTVANYSERPDYIEVKSNQSGERMSFKVVSGVIPDYADHPKGMKISGVKKDGPADKAGLQTGDVIIRLGETDIKNIYDYTYCLGKYKPGDTTEIVVLRGENEEKLTFEMTFAKKD